MTAAVSTGVGSRQVSTVPWGATSVRAPSVPGLFGANCRVVLCADRNGLVAIACYEVPHEGLSLDAFDLVAPFTAAPVLRGEPRVRPGEPRSSAAPIAVAQSDGVLDLVGGIGAATDPEASLGTWLAERRPISLERGFGLPRGLEAAERLIGAGKSESGWLALKGE